MLSNFDIEALSDHCGFALNSVIMKDELKSLHGKFGNYMVTT
jgi:hypothetical protein